MFNPTQSTHSLSKYCDFKTGQITHHCQMLLEKAGIDLEEKNITKVAAKLDHLIGYTHNVNAIRSEGKYPSSEHAKKFLKYHCAQRKKIVDVQRAKGKSVSIIMLGGAPLPIRNRSLAAIKIAKKGIDIQNIVIFVRTSEEISKTEQIIINLFKAHALHVSPKIHLVGNVSTGLLEAGLKQTKEEWRGKNYMLASDPMMCDRMEAMAKKTLDEVDASCVGLASIPVKDYRKDLLLAKARTSQEIIDMTLEDIVPANLSLSQDDIIENARVELWFEAKAIHEASFAYEKNSQ